MVQIGRKYYGKRNLNTKSEPDKFLGSLLKTLRFPNTFKK